MNLTKRVRRDSAVQTWCWKCQRPVERWMLTFEVMAHGAYAGTETPVLIVSCHGETASIGCSPEPDVLASFWKDWEEKYLPGLKRIEFCQPDPTEI